MTARERGKKATQIIEQTGIDCCVESIRDDSITVMCGRGVMAYLDGKLLMLGEQIPLTSEPITLYIQDAVNHRDCTVQV